MVASRGFCAAQHLMTVLDIGFDHVEAEDQPCSWEAIKRLSMAIDEASARVNSS